MSEPPLRAVIIPVTPLQQNCTLLWCTATMCGAFVDPGGDLPRLKDAAEKAGVTIEKNSPDPRPHRSLRRRWDFRCGARGFDRGAARGGPLLDRAARRGRSAVRHRRPAIRTRALAERWRRGNGRRAHLRRRALPRPHPRTRRLPQCGIKTRARRGRPVQGLRRPLGLRARRPAAADRLNPRQAMADGR